MENSKKNNNNLSQSQISRSNFIRSKSLSQKKESTKFDRFQLFFGILFHYTDAFTDINTTYQVSKNVVNNKNENNIIADYTFILIPIIGLSLERIFSYLLAMQLERKFQSKKQKKDLSQSKQSESTTQEYTIPLKRKLLIVFLILTYSESLFVWKSVVKGGYIQKYIIKKNLNELCYENVVFLLYGLYYTLYKVFTNIPIEFMDSLQTLTSLISTIYILYQIQIIRIQKESTQIKKQFSDFKKFPYDVQLMLLNPVYIQISKFIQDEYQLYKHHFYTCNKRNLQTSLFIKEDYEDIPIFKQIYIFIYTFIMVSAFALIFTSQTFNLNCIQPNTWVTLGYIYMVPNTVFYCFLYSKKHKKKETTKKMIKYFILLFPQIAAVGFTNQLGPFINNEIPFIKETRPTWMFNLIPNKINLISKILLEAYCTYLTYNSILGGGPKNYLNLRLSEGEEINLYTNHEYQFWAIIALVGMGFLLKFMSLVYNPQVSQNGYNIKYLDHDDQNNTNNQNNNILKNIGLNTSSQRKQQQLQQQQKEFIPLNSSFCFSPRNNKQILFSDFERPLSNSLKTVIIDEGETNSSKLKSNMEVYNEKIFIPILNTKRLKDLEKQFDQNTINMINNNKKTQSHQTYQKF